MVRMNLSKLIEARSKKPLKEFPIPVKELCARYERLFTGAVNDVLREMNLPQQTLPTSITPLRDHMIVAGLAFTIKGAKTVVVENDEMPRRSAMLEAIYEDSVVLWDTSEDDTSAQWGEVMTAAAIKRGCRGAVIDGGIRDTKKILEQNFPVFNRYRTSSAMLGRFKMIGWDIPIAIGSVTIFPGDVVFGDIDGVLIIPRDIAYDVLDRAEEIVAGEEVIKEWVKEGMTPQEITRKGGYF